MIRHTRGEGIRFVNSFYDADGEIASAVSASVLISYPSLMGTDGRDTATETMEQNDDGDWEATWDSSVSDPGVVYWSIQKAGSPAIVEDGQFVLEGNVANVART
jgi:hypothetical protein